MSMVPRISRDTYLRRVPGRCPDCGGLVARGCGCAVRAAATTSALLVLVDGWQQADELDGAA